MADISNQCASIFNAAGIYSERIWSAPTLFQTLITAIVILDVNSPLPNQSINRGEPWTSYNSDYLQRVFGVIEAFKNFPNTMGFFSGNEVINEDSVIQVPSYIRAVSRQPLWPKGVPSSVHCLTDRAGLQVTRDLKQYIAKNANRSIPVGYSAADVRPILGDTWAYLSCNIENSTESRIDFFGLNSYSWCGDSSFTQAGYDQLVAQFSNTTIPVFFSEYGCNRVYPRTFTEVPVLYSRQMTDVMSGGLMYEYSQEVSNYGLISLNDNDTASVLQDYLNLQAQYNTLDVSFLESGNATATSLTPPICKPSLMTASSFDDGFNIPAQPSDIAGVISSGIPKPNVGALTSIGSTTVRQTVYNVSGQAITDLKLNVLADDQSNTPGSNDSGSSTATGTAGGPSATTTHKSIGARMRMVKAAPALLALTTAFYHLSL